MVNPTLKIFSYLFLILSTIMGLSSNSVFNMWIALEINLFMFLSLIMSETSKQTGLALTYLFPQAWGSLLVFMGFISNSMTPLISSELLTTLGMMLKLGMPPAHLWFIKISKNMPWKLMYILMTLQKLIPLTLMSTLITHSILMLLSGTTLIISVLEALYTSSPKAIIAYSSINTTAWFILMNNPMMILSYWLMYSINLVIPLTIMNKMSNKTMKTFKNMTDPSKLINMILLMSLMSLGGVPPFPSFIAKTMMLKSAEIVHQSIIWPILAIYSTLMMTYIFIRMLFKTLYYYQSSTLIQPKLYSPILTIIISIIIMAILTV